MANKKSRMLSHSGPVGYVDKKDTIIKKDWWQNIVAAKVLIISMEYRRFKAYGSSRLNITS